MKKSPKCFVSSRYYAQRFQLVGEKSCRRWNLRKMQPFFASSKVNLSVFSCMERSDIFLAGIIWSNPSQTPWSASPQKRKLPKYAGHS